MQYEIRDMFVPFKGRQNWKMKIRNLDKNDDVKTSKTRCQVDFVDTEKFYDDGPYQFHS